MVQFNKAPLAKQGVTREQREELEHIYALLELTVNTAKILEEDDDLTYATGSVISTTVQNIEFQLQKYWNFPQNPDFHSYQFRLPGCTCAKMDNQERVGSPYKVITQTCPYHGQELENET